MGLTRIFILVWFCIGLSREGLAQEAMAPLRLTLKEALQKADAVNLQVMMSNARVTQAIARLSESQSDLLPHLEGDVSGNRQSVDLRAQGIQFPMIGPHLGPFDSFDARARLTMPLFDASAYERFQAAKKGQVLSLAQLEKTREDVLSLVASLYVSAQRKVQTVSMIKALKEEDQFAYDLAQAGLRQETSTVLDLDKSKADLNQAVYLYHQAQHQANEARWDLEAALQLPLNCPLALMGNYDFFNTLAKVSAHPGFKEPINADVIAAQSQLEASRANQRTAVADFLPKISGTTDYGRSGESPGHGSNTFFVGVQASVPIWEGGLQQAQVKLAQAQIKEDQANLLDAYQQQDVNIAKARASIWEAVEFKISKLQEKINAEESLRIALHAQEIGSGNVLDVLRSKADLALALDDYSQAQADWVMGHINLLHAQGRLRDLIKPAVILNGH